MIVKYIGDLRLEEPVKSGRRIMPSNSLSEGKSYLVLGITFIGGRGGNSRVLYQVLNDFGGISHMPLESFDLEDGKCSSHWIAKAESDGSLLLWPEEFFSEYFHDDLSEGEGTALGLFRDVVKRLKEEAGIS